MPVAGPHGTVYLTGLQWHLWYLARHPRGYGRGPVTLGRLAELTGSGRGRCWHAMSRLRSLDLVGWRAWPATEWDTDRTVTTKRGPRRLRRLSPGRDGRLLVWVPRAARLARPRPGWRAAANDSISTPFGGYLSREGLISAWRRDPTKWSPPLAAAAAARDGPRRGRAPRILWGKCPSGHRVHLSRRSWTVDRELETLAATFTADCRSCGAATVERLELTAPRFARPLSPAELEDPAVFDRRRDAAAATVAGELGPAPRRYLVERLRRDYLEPDLPRADPRARPEPVRDVIERIRRPVHSPPRPRS